MATPSSHGSLLSAPLAALTRVALRIPAAVVILATLLAAACGALAAWKLGFHTSRLDLLNPASEYNQRWLRYLEEFGEEDDVVVVVEAEHKELVHAALEDVALSLRNQERFFQGVMHRRQLGKVRAKGLHLLPPEELERIDRYLADLQPLLRGDWSQIETAKVLRYVNYGLRADETQAAAAFQQLQSIERGLTAALAETAEYQSPWPRLEQAGKTLADLDDSPLSSNEGRRGFILLKLVPGSDPLAGDTASVDALRDILRRARYQHPDVQIGLTGLPIMENDEMRASANDSMRASLYSLAGVALLFIAGFGGVRHPLLTVVALMLGMAWTLGFIVLAVGHLNILSVAFGVILIGLGIDFGIHYVARYQQLRKTESDPKTALVETARSVGPGVVTGGVTTALAFFTASLTQFTGVAELGIIAGGGLLLCILSAMVVLPCLILLCDSRWPQKKSPQPLPLDNCLQPLINRPKSLLLAGAAVTGLLACGAVLLKYDHNLLNLQPLELESVRWERKLLENSDSTWFALSVADSREELLARKEQFEKLSRVGRTEEIATLLPGENESREEFIASLSVRLQSLPAAPPQIGLSLEHLSRELTGLQQFATAGGHTELADRLSLLLGRLHALPADELFHRLNTYQQQVAAELLRQLRLLKNVSQPQSPNLEDIPPPLAERFLGKSGKFLLRVYAQGDVWDMQDLRQFVAQLESVDPQVTGHPVQTYYASRQMQESYLHAAIYSLIAVAIVLMLDFRSTFYTLLAMAPMGLGLVQLFGLMGFFGIPLNPANMIVLPLILGIGIDDGVHVVHDFRHQTGRFRITRSTATAVLITSATTMIGFGSLMFAEHQGLKSLGQVLTLGVFCCLGSSLLLLPAWLGWMTRHRTAAVTETPKESSVVIVRPGDRILVASPDDESAEIPATPAIRRRAA